MAIYNDIDKYQILNIIINNFIMFKNKLKKYIIINLK